jgi:hypothetical protein
MICYRLPSLEPVCMSVGGHQRGPSRSNNPKSQRLNQTLPSGALFDWLRINTHCEWVSCGGGSISVSRGGSIPVSAKGISRDTSDRSQLRHLHSRQASLREQLFVIPQYLVKISTKRALQMQASCDGQRDLLRLHIRQQSRATQGNRPPGVRERFVAGSVETSRRTCGGSRTQLSGPSCQSC